MFHPLAIDHTVKDLVRFNNGSVRSGRVSPLQGRSFGDPVDMLYSELITEQLNAVANVPSFGSSFVLQGYTNLPTFSIPSHQQEVPGQRSNHLDVRHRSNQVW